MSEWLVPIIVGVMSLAAAVIVGWFTYRATRKRDVDTTALAERRDTIADRDNLIDQLQEDIKVLKGDMESQKRETATLREEVRQVRDHNNALITYTYRLIALAREHGYQDKIPKPAPQGIHL